LFLRVIMEPYVEELEVLEGQLQRLSSFLAGDLAGKGRLRHNARS
jgi:hypothetical protein